MGNHLLLSILALPVAGTFILIIIKEQKTIVLKTISAIITGMQLWIVVQLISGFDNSVGYLQFVEHLSWINLLHIDFIIGLKGINLLFLALANVVFFTLVFTDWQMETRQKSFFVLTMLLNAGITGLFIAFDLFLFLMFYGITLFAASLLIAMFTPKSENVGYGQFGMHALISFSLITIGILIINNQNQLAGFNLNILAQNPASLSNIQTAGFFIFLLGFLFLTPLAPFHTWYISSAEKSITSVSILILTLLSKISIFGILHIVIPLFPQSSVRFALVFGVLGLISILYFAFAVFSFHQYRKIIIYFTGYTNALAFLGLAALLSVKYQNPDAAITGLNGAVIQSIASALIIFVMMLVPKIHSVTINNSSDNFPNRWIATFLMLIVFMAGIGLPGFLNFVGQFLCFSGAFRQFSTGVFTVAAMIGLILVGIQFFKIIQSTIQKTGDYEFTVNAKEISNEMVIIPAILILLFLLGVFPGAILQIIDRSVYSLIEFATAI